MIDPTTLEKFLPESSWFHHNPGGIHGVTHVSRVLWWAAKIADEIGMPTAIQREELLWAAAVHDVGRLDDGKDQGHGRRSAQWAMDNLVRHRPETARCDMRFIAELCTWHEVSDNKIEHLSLELVILKDADGLDRVRISDLDPSRLRLQRAAGIVDLARILERETRHLGVNGGSAILRAAARLGSSA